MSRTSDARERLLEATVKLVWPSSYAAVGVDAICEEAQVSKGSFYHFFESKDDLMVAAIDHHWSTLRPLIDAIFAPSRPPVDRLRAYLSFYLTRQTGIKAKYGHVLGCFYNSMGAECIQRVPAITQRVQEINALVRRCLVSALRDAHAEGVVRPGDPEDDATAIYALVQGALQQARIADEPELLRHLPMTGLAMLGASLDPRGAAVGASPKAGAMAGASAKGGKKPAPGPKTRSKARAASAPPPHRAPRV